MSSRQQFAYREATSADVFAMAGCLQSDVDAGPADPRMAAYLDGQHHPQHALASRTAYVALVNNVIIGYVAGHCTRRFGCEGEAQYLYVAATHRRNGVATALLGQLAAWFLAQGARRICVNVDVDSPQAAPFYRENGATPLTVHWYIWPDIGMVRNVRSRRQHDVDARDARSELTVLSVPHTSASPAGAIPESAP